MIIANKPLGLRAAELGAMDVGKGEDPTIGNNRSHFISMLKIEAGMAWVKDGDPWCAIYVAAMLARASGGVERVPFKLYPGARKLFESAAKSEGARLVEVPEAGAIILWRRRRLGVVVGHHIGLVASYTRQTDLVMTLEGNRNMKGERFANVNIHRHPEGSWKRDLVGMVALP